MISKKITYFKTSIITWIKNNKIEAGFLLAVILVAAFFRLYRIDEYLPFLGDEGRDVRVVRRFITSFDLMFVGPRTSIGDMYLGPLYYYLIAPFLLLWNFSPAGPATFVALLGVATVAFIWWVGREWFGKIAGITAALLYAISPLVIDFSKHSWNPNIMPFFALLAIYSTWKIWHTTNRWWFVVLGIAFGTIVQSHYLGILLLPTVGIIWLIRLYAIKNRPQEIKQFFPFSLITFFLFLFLISPLFLFDFKHGWHNFGAMKTFFTDRQGTVSAKPWNAIPVIWPYWRDELIGKIMMVGQSTYSWIIAPLFFDLFVLYSFWSWKKKNLNEFKAYSLLFLWTVIGLLGLGLIKQNIYDHYYGFLFPAPFLIAGAVFQKLWVGKFKWLGILVLGFLVVINLQNNPLKNPPQRQMQNVQLIDQKIIDEADNKTFNFGLIAKRNYDEGYLYFFELRNSQVKEIDPQNIDKTLADQLFVVCEDEVCEPINNPQAQIANFGWAKIENQWEVGGHKLFKLVHKP